MSSEVMSSEVPGSGPVVPAPREGRRFAYPPQLIVVDGGAPQVGAAVAALSELGIGDVSVCGLAKRLEEVWLPGEDAPVVLPRASHGLYLLQRIRDEAHRFANTRHRSARGKRALVSELDGIAGLGPARRAALLARFGSVRQLREATPEEIATVPGIGAALATAISVALLGGGAIMPFEQHGGMTPTAGSGATRVSPTSEVPHGTTR